MYVMVGPYKDTTWVITVLTRGSVSSSSSFPNVDFVTYVLLRGSLKTKINNKKVCPSRRFGCAAPPPPRPPGKILQNPIQVLVSEGSYLLEKAMTVPVKDGVEMRRNQGPLEGAGALWASELSCGDGFTQLVPTESSAVRSAGQLVIPDWVGHIQRTEAALQNLKQWGKRETRCWLHTAFGYAFLKIDARAPSRTCGSWSPAVGEERGAGGLQVPASSLLLGFTKRSISLFPGIEKSVLGAMFKVQIDFSNAVEGTRGGSLGGTGGDHLQFLFFGLFCQFSSSSLQESQVSFKIVSMLNWH